MPTDNTPSKAHAVGINHVALEVGDIGAAVDFYSRFLTFKVTSQNERMAFIYFGDQFLNFTRVEECARDGERHFGIAVDDKDLVRRTLEEMGVELIGGPFLDFLDPWGNRIEITTYADIMFSKTGGVLRGMGLAHLKKSEKALKELERKGMAPD